MEAVLAALIGALILASVIYDVARMITPTESGCPRWLACGGSAPPWNSPSDCVGLLLHARIDAAAYDGG